MTKATSLIAMASAVLLAGCQMQGTSETGGLASPAPSSSVVPQVTANVPSSVSLPTCLTSDEPSGLPVSITVSSGASQVVIIDGQEFFTVDSGSPIIQAGVYGTGLNSENILNPTEFNLAAWFNPGTRAEHPPGFMGTSVVAGHATTHGGVFNRLAEVHEGNLVTIGYDSGDVVSFYVDQIARDPKTALTDVSTDLGAQIWDPKRLQPCAITWLITCDTSTELVNGHRTGNVAVRLVAYKVDRRMSDGLG